MTLQPRNILETLRIYLRITNSWCLGVRNDRVDLLIELPLLVSHPLLLFSPFSLNFSELVFPPLGIVLVMLINDHIGLSAGNHIHHVPLHLKSSFLLSQISRHLLLLVSVFKLDIQRLLAGNFLVRLAAKSRHLPLLLTFLHLRENLSLPSLFGLLVPQKAFFLQLFLLSF